MSFKILLATLPALAIACTGPAINDNGLNLIKSFESFQPSVYDDGFGNPTLGYGHLCGDATCSEVTFSQPLTEATASQLLANDLVVSLYKHCSSLGNITPTIQMGAKYVMNMLSNTRIRATKMA
jgi:GH24 family phage-related lysozyme (muramidase)